MIYIDPDIQLRRLTEYNSRDFVSGHSLAVETGHCNPHGRGRLPVEECLCVCGLVQNWYVIEFCPLTQNIREANGVVSVEDLFTGCNDLRKTCRIIYEILHT